MADKPEECARAEIDWLLAAASVLAAKKESYTLSGVEMQSDKYVKGLHCALPAWRRSLPALTEQYRICAEVDKCFSLVNSLQAEIGVNLKHADVIRQPYLSRIFSAGREISRFTTTSTGNANASAKNWQIASRAIR